MAKFFLDSASLMDIEEAICTGIVCGVTTNPSILKLDVKGDLLEHLKLIVNLLKSNSCKFPLSVQVMTTHPDEMIAQAEFLKDSLLYESLVIKVPCGWEEIKVINKLVAKGFIVNCTACMTATQITLAINSGVRYASLFFGKAQDSGEDVKLIIENCVDEIDRSGLNSELVIGSLRTPVAVQEAILAHAHILTVRPKLLRDVASHKKTEEAIDYFSKDFLPLKM